MSPSRDFVGNGWSFPVRVGPRGGIALVTGSDEINSALRLIISTAPGERVMRPEFGCAIWDQLFSTTDPNALGLMAQSVRDAISRWEARVDLESVLARVDPDDGSRVLINVSYKIKATNDRRNLVYPFYVIPKEQTP